MNGKCFFIDKVWISSDKLQLHTDASGNLGYGAVFHQNLFYGQWNEEWLTYDIMLKEPYPIDVRGHSMSNWSILFNCDNEALVYVLNKQSYLEPKVYDIDSQTSFTNSSI